MEIYNFPEHGHADTYLIQGTEPNPYLTSPLEQFEAMYNEGAPEFVVEQGLYYPTATNYGYICAGLESPGEWDDHNRIFGLDGQDIQYTGAQTESLPYLYYTPSYGYTQSPYNPYNPYIPGAMIGVDGSFVGTQPYYTMPSYDSSISSPAYFPVVVQSSPDMIANGTADPFMNTSSSTANRADGPGPKHNLSATSANFNLNSARSVSNQTISSSRVPEGSKANAGPSKQSATQIPQSSGAQVIDNLSHGKSWSNRNQLNAALPSGNGMSNFGSSANGRVMVDKSRPKFHFGRVPNDVNNSPDALGEQNRGPRTNKSKNQLALKAYTTRAGDCDEQGNIIIYTDQYNKDDFPVDYVSGKFFVIKSYSEDDVHKSIKYNVWSSTPNGNKKLNSAYEDAQKTAALESRICPIFLFFSVNASGQFCGVAEMTGPVDFHKDMDFWQQDKWSGSFPVKWHIVKDLPNPNFRHIILENNENKPVTNSRDTQEIRFKKGMEMLRIFKNYTSKTSLLDDFMYYENRQKILQEEKARLLINSYGNPFLAPVIEPPRKLNHGLNMPSNEDEKPTTENNNLNISENNAATSSEEPILGADVSNPIVGNEKSNDRDLLKIGSVSINAKQAAGSKPLEGPATATVAATTIANSEPVDIVTVGSMPVKVNGFSKSTAFLTVGTIPLDPRSLQLDEAGVSTTRGSHKG